MGRTYFMVFTFAATTTYVFGQGMENSKYLGQDPPGLNPKLFTPGIVSTPNQYEFGSVFSREGDQLYYAVKLDDNWKAEIRYMEFKNGAWGKPAKLNLNSTYGYNDPFLSQDGNRLYFMSNKPKKGNGQGGNNDLWYIEKKGDEWSAPVNLGAPVNSKRNEYYVSIAENGALYFASNVHTTAKDEDDYDIYYAIPENGKFGSPIRMGNSINSLHFDVDPFIAPDESYLIFCSSQREDGFGKGDLYISFKKKDNTWSKAKNMGSDINTKGHEFCPFVTKDGKYLFYTSDGDIYWASAEVIEILRTQYINY